MPMLSSVAGSSISLRDEQPLNAEALTYEVTRAYHGSDDESGELITDLNLGVYTP